LYLFEERPAKLRYDGNKCIDPGQVEIYYNQPINSFGLASEMASDSGFHGFFYTNDTKDTVKYWYSEYYKHRTKLFLVANDTLKDTVRIELKYIDKDSIFTKKSYLLSIGNQFNTGQGATQSKNITNVQELYKPLKLFFSRPVVGINPDKGFHLYEDTAKKEIPSKFSIDEKTKQFVTFDFEKKENTFYALEIPDSAFRDIFGTWNTKYTYKFKTDTKDNYGNLNITLTSKHPEKSYIVKIVEANSLAVIQEIPFSGEAQKKIQLQNVAAGNYKVMAIDDVNGNGKWDTGNFKKRIQPEKIVTFKDTYILKGGWDLDIEVKF